MKKIFLIGSVASAVALTACLAACASQPVEADGDSDSASDAATKAVSFDQMTSQSDRSLLATHPQELEGEASTVFCLSCHDYGELADDSAKDLLDEGGKTVFNPHAGHVEFECTDCHSAETDPVLQCNSCHYITAPEGWADPDEDAKAMYVEPGTIYGDIGYSTAGDSYAIGEGAGLGMQASASE